MDKQTYIIDGVQFSTLEEFTRHTAKVMFEGYDWRGNMDALNDILRGGYGPPPGGYVILWKDSELSRERLGHAAMALWLEKILKSCHPTNVPSVSARLAEAKVGRGETLFDMLVEVIQCHSLGGSQGGRVELRLL